MRERISLRARIDRVHFTRVRRPSFAVIFEYFWKLIYYITGWRRKEGGEGPLDRQKSRDIFVSGSRNPLPRRII